MRRALAFVVAALWGGCGVPERSEIVRDVRRDVADRLGTQAPPDGEAAGVTGDELERILADGLTADEAVRIAVANGPDVQVALAALGAERAALIQASTPPDPTVAAAARLPLEGDGIAYELELLQNLSGFLAVPAGRRSAGAALDAARLRAVESTVDRAAEARAAFRHVQGDGRVLEHRRTAYEIAGAAYEVAERLFAAGNITRLELELRQAELEEARLSLSLAESALLRSRTRLERVLGLWGPTAAWRVAEPLPAAPAKEELDLDTLEARAVERSLGLTALRRQSEAADAAITRARVTGWVPRLAVGASAESETSGEWTVGPAVSVGLPLFDRNQGASPAPRRSCARRSCACAPGPSTSAPSRATWPSDCAPRATAPSS